MDAVPLDPDGYGGTYKLVGGRPSLDLVNTISWPGTARAHDWLATAQNVELWLQATELTGSISHARLLTTRRVTAGVLRPLARGMHPPATAVEAFNRDLRSVMTRRRLDPQSLTWTLSGPPDPVRAAILLDAADIITTEEVRRRLKHCPECDWLFEDLTRNGRRRWCDMADCGSRVKARTHYHRTKTKGPT